VTTTIVVGVDGSATSWHAFDLAVALARDMRDPEVVVVFAPLVYLGVPNAAEAMHFGTLDAAEMIMKETVADGITADDVRWKVVSRDGQLAEGAV
jgi:hypothetical protein